MGNLLTSPAQFDAARSASGACSASEGAPLVAATGPAPRAAAAARPPSSESVKAAALAGIAGAAEQRSSLPTRPAEMWAELGAEERAFVRRCFGRLSPSSLVDAHCHLAGQGSNGSGCYLSPSLRRPLLHPLSALKKQLFLTASGVSGSDADCDLRFAEVLAQLKRHCGPEEGAPHGRCHVLALDEYYGEDGVADPAKTGMHVPNEWVWRVAAAFPDVFVPVASVHPYRKDALQQLQHWADKGTRMIKWLPNAMGINPCHPLCAPFYAAMRRLGLVLLSHTGVEHSVDFGFHDNALGNPLLLRAPLEAGVRVIAAHCASEGHAVICGHEALELGLVTGAARTAGNADSCDAAGPDAGREGSAGEEQEIEEEGSGDAQAFKRRKAAESSGAGSSATAAAAESKSADTAAPSDGASRHSSSSRLGVAPAWLTSLLGFGGPAQAGLAIPSSQAASGGDSCEELGRSAIACSSQSSSSRKRKLDCSGPASAAAAAASPCPFSAIGASSAHRTAGHSALSPGAVPPPRQLRVSNLDLLIAMMDLERYKDLLFADISSVCAFKRAGALETLLNRRDLHDRFSDGTDYPVPAVYVVVWTSQLRRQGLITGDEERMLNRLFDFNPLLFDFCLKRCLRSSTGGRFSDCVFSGPAALRDALHPSPSPSNFSGGADSDRSDSDDEGASASSHSSPPSHGADSGESEEEEGGGGSHESEISDGDSDGDAAMGDDTGEAEANCDASDVAFDSLSGGGGDLALSCGSASDASASEVHEGVFCDGCGLHPIRGPRFHCLSCTVEGGFDLCAPCRQTENQHSPSHKFVRLPGALEPATEPTRGPHRSARPQSSDGSHSIASESSADGPAATPGPARKVQRYRRRGRLARRVAAESDLSSSGESADESSPVAETSGSAGPSGDAEARPQAHEPERQPSAAPRMSSAAAPSKADRGATPNQRASVIVIDSSDSE